MTAQEQKQVDQLFREKTIPEVKNYGMEISRELASINDRFNEKMASKYWDILDVTNEVSGLSTLLKEVDQDFRELCYNDNLYQLKKLPELEVSFGEVSKGKIHDKPEHNETSNRDDMMVMNITEWTLSIHKFISEISTASSETIINTLIENLSNNFSKINDDVHRMSRFQDVIKAKCKALQEYIVKAIANSEVYLTLLQWIKMDSIFQMKNLPWDSVLYQKFEENMYSYVFEEEEDLDSILFGSTNPVIKRFIETETFKNKLVSYMEKSIDEQFAKIRNQLSDLDHGSASSELNNVLYPDTLSDRFSVQDIIKKGTLYSMGLNSQSKIELYELVNPLINQIEKMKLYGCREELIERYKKNLLEILEKMIPQGSSDGNTNNDFSEVLDKYNKLNLDHLVKSQILAVHQLHNE